MHSESGGGGGVLLAAVDAWVAVRPSAFARLAGPPLPVLTGHVSSLPPC